MCEEYGEDFDPGRTPDRIRVLQCGIEVRQSDIPGILRDEEARELVWWFGRWRRIGFPFPAWAEVPGWYVEAVDRLAQVDRFYHPPMV